MRLAPGREERRDARRGRPGSVILMLSVAPGTTTTVPPRAPPPRRRRYLRARTRARRAAPAPRNACGVCAVDQVSRGTVATTTPSRDPLDRVRDRDTGNRSVRAGPDRVDHAREYFGVGHRPGRVVHHHDLRIGRNRGEAGAHRLRSGRAADDGDHRPRPQSIPGRDHDDHAVGGPTRPRRWRGP